MPSKTNREGWLLVDHRACPGLADAPVFFEAATITCSHCQRQVIRNPERTRARAYCPKCDHYICDQCEAVRVASGGECKPFNRIIEEVQEGALSHG
jgi:hypothetical protein